MKYYFLLACTFLMLCWGEVSAQNKYSNEFLKIGVSARAMGMGNAYSAVAEDVTAGYWNPAGLADLNAILYPEVCLMHASYFANIANYNYAGFTMPVDSLGKRRFGASIIRLGVDDIPNTLQLIAPNGNIEPDKVTSFSASDFAVLLSYAWKMPAKGLTMGSNVKIIYRGVGRFANAWGFGLDLGLKYRKENFRLGLAVYDVTNTFNAWTFNTETFEEAFINTGNVIPQNSIELTRPSARLGVAYEFSVVRRIGLTLSVDNAMYFDGQRNSVFSSKYVSLDPNAGLEISYKNNQARKVFFLRGGIMNLQNGVDADGNDAFMLFPTGGIGLVFRNFQFDYALSNIGNITENLHSHIFSFKFFIR